MYLVFQRVVYLYISMHHCNRLGKNILCFPIAKRLLSGFFFYVLSGFVEHFKVKKTASWIIRSIEKQSFGVRMRFAGQEYRGKNVLVALIDSGVDSAHPSLKSMSMEGYSLSLRATNHVAIDPNFHDEHGHGTKMALHLLRFAPGVRILAIKITDTSLRASSDLIASGIELAYKGGASVINVSMGTPNMGRAMLLRDCSLAAMEHNALVVASAHPMGQRAYPADLPEVTLI